MDTFATEKQYAQRFGAVDNANALKECLGDATAAIKSVLDAHGVDYSEPNEEFADRLMRVCRSVANRIMPTSSDKVIPGTTSMMTVAGSYTQQVAFGSSYGLPKLLPSELKMLGVGGGRIGWGRM